ncbi:uncharacterized protein PGTG_02213 [Puccinia graminis f. sp. tritici CRL 75-36-700-3]|uniref:Multiple myeloma tumor-associated protein 2-like N-terminal domain-containing protein n=1 Tax=Puccinia graminis f. sp. tritici (strain CRL 75-36-700-3 / race SCCL) TaxID=418459 RepID=E3JXH7_PUCGT|nr:uncharacterized protein PGTG_02213 [Puccinia graminis f. sp. tritici CRL 75-36-700-3]EFP76752.2 hypothetical protein PGTG_02213 [Puccinia graminis f. sp. tritici CRL 75-36-700-3]
MFSGPVRGGTRGGQGDFKWSDVADDKDRENYLGHSILAPVGRWQKNKDITWYNKDGGAIDEDERLRAKREEIQRIKAAEEDALSAALGFKPAPRDPMSSAPETSSNAIPLGPAREGGGQQDRGSDGEEEIQRRKAEKAARKAERAAKRERKLEEKMAKKSASKSSKYADPEVQRSSRSDRADDRTRDQRIATHIKGIATHIIRTAIATVLQMRPVRIASGFHQAGFLTVADVAHPLKVPIHLENPAPLGNIPIVPTIIAIAIQITIGPPNQSLIPHVTHARYHLPFKIDINVQYLPTNVEEIQDAGHDHHLDGLTTIIDATVSPWKTFSQSNSCLKKAHCC